MSNDEPPKTPDVEMEEPKPEIDLGQKVANLEKELESAKSNLAKMDSLNDKIMNLETEVANRDEKIGTLNEEIKELKSTDSQQKESIKDLEHRLSQRELEITRLEGSVEDLSIAKKKIEDLQREYKKLEEEMRAFQKIAENEPRFVILKDLTEFGEMRLNQVSMKAGVSPAQAKKWLEELERAGLIEIHGEGRDSNPLVSKKK
ncbi:MAG: hypothetical protein FK732_02860 [Asgard group archaeon]|nr:hypothetical protein [Asgard group archaeon]